MKAKKITAARFKKSTGQAPIQDDLERSNCTITGAGHRNCGWCYKCDFPKFMGCECARKIK